jgi:hypothetical protein
MSRGPLLGLSLAAAVLVGLAIWFGETPASQRFALSPQQCNTECQRRQTDCILDCDGKVPCERRCTETGKACVQRCLRGADAGSAGSGGRGAGRIEP